MSELIRGKITNTTPVVYVHVYGIFGCNFDNASILSLSPPPSPSLPQFLTTHATEEADHLCTRIEIMNFGRLRCLGTQNQFKSKLGTGYQLAFNCAPGHVSGVEKFVRNNLRKAVHIETYTGIVYMYD